MTNLIQYLSIVNANTENTIIVNLGAHVLSGTGSSLGTGIGSTGLGPMHHHTPPIPVEPAVAPVPVIEQESVLDLSRPSSDPIVSNVLSSQISRDREGNQEQ